MKKHWLYLKYVLRHKFFVFQEGMKLGVPLWQLLVHDLSKFRPDEWRPYAEYFNGGPHKPWAEFPAGMKYEWVGAYSYSKEGVQERFNEAWLKHLHRNPHHWQHWVLRNDDGTTEALPMPYRYMLEMVADWKGAGRAIHGKDETLQWYDDNKHKMVLDVGTRIWVEEVLVGKPVYGELA